MRRSPMPARRKPLRTRTRLAGGVILHRRRAPSRAWTILRLQVLARSEGLCECCGAGLNPLAFEAHHRQLKSQGGRDAMVNLLALRPECHRRAHRGDRAAAERAGVIVPSWQSPARVPVLLHGVDRMYLAGAGYAPAMDGGDTGA
jgi:hypothetical protein